MAYKNKTKKQYMDAIKNYDTEEYRVACHNCNHATKQNRICPHKII